MSIAKKDQRYVIKATNQNKEKNNKEPMSIQSKNKQLLEARENASCQVAIGLSLGSDWSKGWCDRAGFLDQSQSQIKGNQCLLSMLP